MGCEKPLGLFHRLELPHVSLTNPGRFVRLLSPIILILFGTVDRFRDQFPMSNPIATQLVCHYLPGIAAMTAQ
jgi:hypothetical protein